jgi:hypothetical protein
MARKEVNQITEKAFTGVKASEYTVIDAGVYNATLTSFSDVRQGMNGEYVFWNFTPDGHDTEVSIITSIGGGWKSKGMEIARRLKGKSDATDTRWGRDIKDKRPRVDWGPELKGSRATIVAEKIYDEEEEIYRNRVTNVVAEGALKPVEEAEAEDFESIPF